MIMGFNKAWNENMVKLREYLKTHKMEEYDDYGKLVQLVADIILKEHNLEVKEIYNNDDYSGEIFYLLDSGYTWDSYITYIYYGSCSSCDTILRITNYCSDELPNDQQLYDFMILCLHIIQRCKKLSILTDGYEGGC